MNAIANRILFNILVKDLQTSAAFYRQLASLEQVYTSDWYIVMTLPGQPEVQLGLIDRVSEFAPRHAGGIPQGTFLTIVVDDVFAALERAREMGVEVIEEPRALDYGQTRALIRDPNGVIVDLSTPNAAVLGAGDASGKATGSDLDQAEQKAVRR